MCRTENFKKSIGVTYFKEDLTHLVSLNRENKEDIVKNFKPMKMIYLSQKHLK